MENKKITSNSLFGKQNYTWMLIAIAIVGLGLILMSGGNSTDVKNFNTQEVYSKMRITVAPILILVGLALAGFAIFKKSE
jgi:Protein of unknown function (DUF3098)